jgi:hypothetical protein
MRKTAEDYASRLNGGIYLRALWWTYNSLVEDGELQEFFEGIPGLCNSKAVPNALRDFIKPHTKRLGYELTEFMNRTLSSDLVSESVKQKRIVICSKVIDTTHLLEDGQFLRRVFFEDWHTFLRCVEFGTFAQKKWKTNPDRFTALIAQCSAAVVISNVRERDKNWFELVFGQLNIPKPVLYDKFLHCDIILFANLIFVVRRVVQGYSGSSQSQQSDLLCATSKTLKSVCEFDVKNTVPEIYGTNLLTRRGMTNGLASSPSPRLYSSILTNCTMLCIEASVSVSPSVFFTTTDDGIPILDDATPYPKCTNVEHLPTSPVEELQFDEPPPAPSPIPSATVIPPSPGLPPASGSIASLHSLTSDPASSS